MIGAKNELWATDDDPARPLVSVIIPAYQSKLFIWRALTSLRRSKTRLEVIVVENGEAELVEADLRDSLGAHELRMMRLDPADLSSARNHGLRGATGEWILFLDSDDWVEIDLYLQLAKRYRSTRCELIKVGQETTGEGTPPHARSREKRVEPTGRVLATSGPVFLLRSLLVNRYSPVTGSYLFRRAHIQHYGLSFNPGRIHEDHLFTASALLQAECVVWTNQLGLHKLVRPDSLTQTATPEESMRGYNCAIAGLQGMASLPEPRFEASQTARGLLIQRLSWIVSAKQVHLGPRLTAGSVSRLAGTFLSYVTSHFRAFLTLTLLFAAAKLDAAESEGQGIRVTREKSL